MLRQNLHVVFLLLGEMLRKCNRHLEHHLNRHLKHYQEHLSEASTSAEVSPKSLPNKNIQDIKTTAQPVAEILAVAQVQKSEPAILL